MAWLRIALVLMHSLFRERCELAVENLALRQQLAILQGKKKRPRIRQLESIPNPNQFESINQFGTVTIMSQLWHFLVSQRCWLSQGCAGEVRRNQLRTGYASRQ